MVNEIQATGASYGPGRISNVRSPRQTAQPVASNEELQSDKVEISQMAVWRARIAEMPEVRVDKILAVRQQIEDGTYDTPDRMDAAFDRLFGDSTSNNS